MAAGLLGAHGARPGRRSAGFPAAARARWRRWRRVLPVHGVPCRLAPFRGGIAQPQGSARARSRGIAGGAGDATRSEEHTSELQSLMRISYAVFCLKKKKDKKYR